MASKITFIQAVATDVHRRPSGGSVTITCKPTVAVAQKMGWAECPDWLKKANPNGKLDASVVQFEPKDGNLSKHAFQLEPAGAVTSFELKRTQVKTGKTAKSNPQFKTELQFRIGFTDNKGAAKLEQYMQTVPASTITVTYTEAPAQEEIPLAEDKQQTLPAVQ